MAVPLAFVNGCRTEAKKAPFKVAQGAPPCTTAWMHPAAPPLVWIFLEQI